MSTTLSVNWGHGRLVPYETIASITAKFCAVNGLKPLQASRFLAQAADVENWEYSAQKKERSEPTAKAIAALLDEPIELVRTVFDNSLDLPACFGTFEFGHHGRETSDIVYCPDCIAQGFHGFFHIQPWFARCLVHGSRLMRTSKELYAAGSLFGRRVATLAKLYHDAGVLTKPPPVHTVHDGDFRSEVIAKIQPYEDWIARIRSVCQAYSKSNLWENSNEHYLPEHAKFLFGRLNWITSIPHEINAALAASVESIEPKIVQFNEAETQAFLACTEQTSFDDVLWFYRKTHAYLDQDCLYRSHAKHTVKAMRENHHRDQCRCSWGWNRRVDGWRGMWYKVSPDGWPYWDLSCPHEVAQERLEDEWINFRPAHWKWAKGSTRAMYLNEYWKELWKFEQKGLALKIKRTELAEEQAEKPPKDIFAELLGRQGNKGDELDPDVQLKFPDSLRSVTEKVLQTELSLDIDAYKRWLTLLEKGESLATSSHLPASINIFYQCGVPQICNGGLMMVTWPVPSA